MNQGLPKPPPPSRREQKRAANRQKLLDTAVAVFLERGYHPTRIEDIITRAGMGKGTFYLYFEDKESLFGALVDEFFGRIRETLVWVFENVDPKKPIAEVFREETRQFFRIFNESKDLAHVFLRDGKSTGPRIDAKINDHYREILKISSDTLKFAVDFGLLSQLDPQIATICIVGAIEKVYELWIRGELKGQQEQIANETSSFLIRGCGLDPQLAPIKP